MMKLTPLLFSALLAFVQPLGLASADAPLAGTPPGAMQNSAQREAVCPPATKERFSTAQTSQADCCKGHKGVCGCRAGKIVCCDNTISVSCTCHGDSGMEN